MLSPFSGLDRAWESRWVGLGNLGLVVDAMAGYDPVDGDQGEKQNCRVGAE